MEAIGLIDTIISLVSACPRARFSKTKIVIAKKDLLDMLDKLKLVIETEGAAAKQSIVPQPSYVVKKAEVDPKIFGVEGEALIRQAKEEANNIRQGSDEYAKNVLKNLQVLLNKMMLNLEVSKERLKTYREADK